MILTNKKIPLGYKVAVGGIAVTVGYVLFALLAPAPKPVVLLAVSSGVLDTGQPNMTAWPATGGAAIGAMGSGVLATNNADQPTPTASIAKVILAMAVLKQRPLQLGQPGQTITFTENDIAIYKADLALNGSVVPVNVGEQLSEYQALEALMLPSGNNIASSLANWAFGSEQQYITYAAKMLSDLGLSKTHLDDTSGYSPKTVSTPRELVLIGEEALKNQVLAQIVNQKQATLPVAGTVNNVNTDLGQRDVNGIKTGNTDEAGGCLLFSATRRIGNKDVTLVGAVQALPDIQQALNAAPDLVDNGYLNFVYVPGLPAQVGTMTVPWAKPVNIIPSNEVGQVVWSGAPLKRDIAVHPGLYGNVGQAKIGNQTSDLILESAIPQPSLRWRLTHPLQIIKGFISH
ncbi:MAG TPA: serine hydrolase [Patescibacteria group bacterium]|nr:serine hydrolase [Patescibacteria group bacterium]